YEAGDLLMALGDVASPPKVVELSDVVAGRAGRRDAAEITIFKSCGIGVEDVAAGGFVYERALAESVGRKLQSS
ncbi:MAG: ornithine cyclodeaminase family protein, partial [Bryobacteraceae bacterium]